MRLRMRPNTMVAGFARDQVLKKLGGVSALRLGCEVLVLWNYGAGTLLSPE